MIDNIKSIISAIGFAAKLMRGGLMLFIIIFAITLITAILCSTFGALYASTLFISAGVGALSTMLISTLYSICSMKMPMNKDWGMLGIIIALFFTILLY